MEDSNFRPGINLRSGQFITSSRRLNSLIEDKSQLQLSDIANIHRCSSQLESTCNMHVSYVLNFVCTYTEAYQSRSTAWRLILDSTGHRYRYCQIHAAAYVIQRASANHGKVSGKHVVRDTVLDNSNGLGGQVRLGQVGTSGNVFLSEQRPL